MTKPARAISVIHQVERSIRILELARDRTQRALNRGMAKQGAEPSAKTAKRRALIAAYNRAILGAKAHVNELLEKGE